MLAVVKKPHIEMCLNGRENDMAGLIALLRRSYEVTVIVDVADNIPPVEDEDDGEECVKIRDTEFWRKRMTPGTVLQGYRLKHEMTQRQLSAKSGISHATISAYEHNKRIISRRAAVQLAKALGETPDGFYEKLMS